jgi:uncharacterized membrane protein YGL010W
MAVLAYGLNGSTVRTFFIGIWLLLLTALVLLHAVRSRGTSGVLTLSWGLKGFKVLTQGVGGIIVLLVVTGLVIGSLLSFMVDVGILSTMVTN